MINLYKVSNLTEATLLLQELSSIIENTTTSVTSFIRGPEGSDTSYVVGIKYTGSMPPQVKQICEKWGVLVSGDSKKLLFD